ncbi:Uncharacterized protein BM_BM6250 [Brugia malayi]|uniref:Large ribosomal subunit protein eL31 n=3 Tax=Brugia malayi TaxID=6279 RepID=A0A1P6C8A8_BRUMA|nr:Uncharacterized protein BM_BM6250 [Brugia malayi]CDQ02670.1 Bm6250, isoform b [Brugia malayi]VIO96667.1 Uncharacterized protein BM_BM6250 [Brugia malayi]
MAAGYLAEDVWRKRVDVVGGHLMMAPGKKGPKQERKPRSAMSEVVTREYTVNLHRRLHGVGFKKRAPQAIKAIRKFAEEQMGTKDVRVHIRLNEFLWSKGVKNVPYRVRVRLSRRHNDDESSADRLYTLVTHVPVTTFKKLTTVNVDNEE